MTTILHHRTPDTHRLGFCVGWNCCLVAFFLIQSSSPLCRENPATEAQETTAPAYPSFRATRLSNPSNLHVTRAKTLNGLIRDFNSILRCCVVRC
jgi:hypothetical protein